MFDCGYVDDAMTKAEIKNVYEKTNEILDPHTVIGYKVAKEATDRPIVSLATASPYKFSIDVLKSIDVEVKDEFEAMHKLNEITGEPIPEGLAKLESLPILHKDVIEIEEMYNVVENAMEDLFNV